MISREECIARVCALQAKVARTMFSMSDPKDCFCWDKDRGGHDLFHEHPDCFRNTGEAIEWIEQVVHEAIAKAKGST